MKIFGVLIAMMMVAVGAKAQEAEGEGGSPLTYNLGIATNDIWRGGNCTGLSFMGGADFSAGGFSAGAAAITAIGKDD